MSDNNNDDLHKRERLIRQLTSQKPSSGVLDEELELQHLDIVDSVDGLSCCS